MVCLVMSYIMQIMILLLEINVTNKLLLTMIKLSATNTKKTLN